MAFLADITSHLNHLNVQLQGRNQMVSDLYASMNAFQYKVALFKAKSLNARKHFSSTEPTEKTAAAVPGLLSGFLCHAATHFSTMKHIKSKERNRLTDETLFQHKQTGCTNTDIDIQSTVCQQERPQISLHLTLQ